MIKTLLKDCIRIVATLAILPCALLSGMGRVEAIFELFAQLLALGPGIPGSYLRVAYYALTLRKCSRDCYIGVGSFFAHPQAEIHRNSGIGPYCILGKVVIGEGVAIASGVQVLSGSKQRQRDSQNRLARGVFTEITIGARAWIGTSSVIMANIGENATVAAGSVVMRAVRPGTVVAGNPARTILEPSPAEAEGDSQPPSDSAEKA